MQVGHSTTCLDYQLQDQRLQGVGIDQDEAEKDKDLIEEELEEQVDQPINWD